MYRRSNYVLGAIFLILGGLLLLRNLDILDFALPIVDIGFFFTYFWPLFIIIPGLIMHLSYFGGRNVDPGILVPGGILLTVGATCQISMLFDLWGVMWPGFILAVAVGLFELYLFGSREKALLIPVGILGGLSLVFFSTISLPLLFSHRIGQFLIPAVLILIGVMVIFRDGPRGRNF